MSLSPFVSHYHSLRRNERSERQRSGEVSDVRRPRNRVSLTCHITYFPPPSSVILIHSRSLALTDGTEVKKSEGVPKGIIIKAKNLKRRGIK